MAASPPSKVPKLRYHKASGRAMVRVNGRYTYLGPWDAPETAEAYQRLVAELAAHGGAIPTSPEELTIVELAARYGEYCAGYYLGRMGEPTSTMHEITRVLATVVRLYRSTKVRDFGPVAFRTVRNTWIGDGLSVTTINKYGVRLRAMFKWGVSHDFVPVEVYQKVCTVPGLRRGRGVGRDTPKRLAVPLEHVEATLAHMPKVLQGIIRLILLTGARPTEVLRLQRRDIDCTGPVWVATIRDHKLAYRGVDRRLYFGPRAQAVLRPFLLRGDDDYLFSPIEAERERHANCNTHRHRDAPRNQKKTDRVIGFFYDHTGLAKAIRRVCKEHGIPHWTPYQLRHAACTAVEATSDPDTARAVLGHSELSTTAIYLHRDQRMALEWAAKNG